MKLCVGIPTTGDVKTKTLFSVAKLLQKYPEANLVTWEGCNVHQARINIVSEAIRGNCTHLLFIDSDMVFEPDALKRLLQRDKEIVGVDANCRSLPLTSTVKIHDEEGNKIYTASDDLYECYAVGTGFMLIKMSVFQEIEKPWFFYEQDKDGDMKVGSDMWFCRQARNKDIKIWCDPTIKIGHLGDFIY